MSNMTAGLINSFSTFASERLCCELDFFVKHHRAKIQLTP